MKAEGLTFWNGSDYDVSDDVSDEKEVSKVAKEAVKRRKQLRAGNG